MEQYYNTTLTFHVLCGTMSLLTGIIAMSSKKGGRVHKKSGLIYFYVMLLTGFTALPIAYYKDNVFLLLIAIFSLYLVSTGYRMTRRKKGNHHWIDIAISLTMAIASIYMISTKNIIVVVFGSIGLLNSYVDIKGMFFPAKEKSKLGWLYGHLGKMSGSYISAVTAFLLNNITTDFPLLIWFGPTVIGAVFITYWIIFYKRKERKKVEVSSH